MAVQLDTALAFHALSPEWEDRVAQFNQRLAHLPPEVPHSFPTRQSARWSREAGGMSGIFQEYFLAVQAEVVRGAYVLKWQPFDIGQDRETIGNLQLPLSEGLVDKRFALTGIQLLRDALRRSGSTYALGMGGLDKSLPRLLKTLGWWLHPVPMRVRILRPARVLRMAPYLRTTSGRRFGCDLLAWSGIGWIAISAYQRWRSESLREQSTVQEVAEFGAWADDIWRSGAHERAFGGVRGADALNHLYPRLDDRFTRLRVELDGEIAGWALLTRRAQPGHRHFGSLQLGALVDCAARPGAERAVVREATAWLRKVGADLIVTNQSHAKWLSALDQSGYLTAPSNYIFAASPHLTERISREPDWVERLHITRGDGDGPINL